MAFGKVNDIDDGCFYDCENHTLSNWILRELRSNHAGETGAVAIYKGILWLTLDPTVIRFAEKHLESERRHLAAIEDILPPTKRSSLLLLWSIAGFLVGMAPAMFGPPAIYVTIEAVEQFVVRHYDSQSSV